MPDPIKIDAKLAIPDPRKTPPDSKDRAPLKKAAVKHIHQEMAKGKAAIPYAELVVVVAEGTGKALYDVVRWNGGEVSDVFLVTYDVLGPLSVGSTAIMRYYDSGEPYLKGPGIGFFNLDEEEETILIGEWMQAEGNPYLSQCGVSFIEFPSGVSVVLDLEGSSTEENGMNRLLGLTVHEGMFFVATYVANEALTGYAALRMRAYRLGDTNELVWTVDHPVTLGAQADKLFRANFFFDVGNRVLTAAHAKVWSLRLTTDWQPDGVIVETDMDAKRAASFVGPYGLIESFDFTGKWRVLRRKDDLQWEQVVDNLDVEALLGSSNLIRPWPWVMARETWYLLHEPDTITPKLAGIHRTGSLALSSIPIPDPEPVEITSLLEAAEVQYSSEGTTGGQPYPYQENVWIDPPGSGDLPFFPHTDWGGRIAPTPDPVSSKVFVCPRRGGAVSSEGYFQWTDLNEFAECVPSLRATSDGKLVYAAIEPKPILTYGSKVFNTLVSTGTVGAYHVFGKDGEGNDINDRWFIEPPELVSLEEATENGGFYLAVGPSDEILLNYEDYHRPQLTHGHWTVIRALSTNGNIAWETDLSSGPFVPARNFGSTNMTEALPWPENVYDIKVGPQGSGADYEDAIILAQTRRETLDAPISRPCFRFLSKDGAIRSTVMCSPGDIVEASLVGTEEEFTAFEDNQSEFYLTTLPVHEVTAVFVNDVEQDISDTEFNYLTDSQVWHSGVPCVEGDVVKILYTYTENPSEANQYEWAVDQVALAGNINSTENCSWALVGVYSNSILNGNTRTDIFVLDLSDPDNVTIQDTLTAENSSLLLPRQSDFDRFVFTATGVYWIGPFGGYQWLKFA